MIRQDTTYRSCFLSGLPSQPTAVVHIHLPSFLSTSKLAVVIRYVLGTRPGRARLGWFRPFAFKPKNSSSG